ncbi:hypothetical protein [Anianabacter salinae]|uniref:hypothetical protein n=1 Tax=Anianabacter salinae TaxID=2851023 RepID=UPI00225E55F2|nr:hypothetical protein [Anianabacter salinae]MBV0911734.1 hypothetical protein [Anianabacter salinae]
MFTTFAKMTAAAALTLTTLALPAGGELPGEMGATHEDGPYSWLPEAMAHGDGPLPDAAPEMTPEEERELIAMLSAEAGES